MRVLRGLKVKVKVKMGLNALRDSGLCIHSVLAPLPQAWDLGGITMLEYERRAHAQRCVRRRTDKSIS